MFVSYVYEELGRRDCGLVVEVDVDAGDVYEELGGRDCGQVVEVDVDAGDILARDETSSSSVREDKGNLSGSQKNLIALIS